MIFCSLPAIEAVLEVLLTKCDQAALDLLANSSICLVNDFTKFLTGQTISYLEFS